MWGRHGLKGDSWVSSLAGEPQPLPPWGSCPAAATLPELRTPGCLYEAPGFYPTCLIPEERKEDKESLC